MSAPQLIALTDTELNTLHGVGPLAFSLYVLLRMFADYRTGTVGRTRPISLAMLASYAETHTRRGAGVQITQPSEKEVRTALDRLSRAGLLRRLAGDRLAFLLPLALTASARPAQTGHVVGTDLSPKSDTVEPAPAQGIPPEPGTAMSPRRTANRAHIMNHEDQNPPGSCFRAVDKPASARAGFPGFSVATLRQTTRANPEKVKSGFAEEAGGSPKAEAEHERLLRIGRRKGIEARPGESWQEYAARLFGTRSRAPVAADVA